MAGNYNRTPEQNKKHSELCKGKTGKWKRTRLHNKAMSESTKGRVFTPEHLLKLKESQEKRWREGDLKEKFADAIVRKKEERERRAEIPKDKRFSRPLGKNGNWKGGITPENTLLRTSKQNEQWRTTVFERDGYTCVWCKSRGVHLQAHHIKKFSEYSQLRFEVSNGITLCKPCHNKTKKKEESYESEFEEYIRKLNNTDFINAVKALQ